MPYLSFKNVSVLISTVGLFIHTVQPRPCVATMRVVAAGTVVELREMCFVDDAVVAWWGSVVTTTTCPNIELRKERKEKKTPASHDIHNQCTMPEPVPQDISRVSGLNGVTSVSV